MRTVRSAVLVLSGLLLLVPASARAQKLDNDDKKFLNDVRPLILPEEEATFKRLKDKADRLEFQKIFWARRDPDLATPENEFQQQYLKDRATADQNYRVSGTPGSTTDCGRTYILLGKPDEVQQRDAEGTMESGLRRPELWTYKDRADRKFTGGKAVVAFDSECRAASGTFAQQLDRLAAAKIVHPNIDYKVGKEGHLVKVADQLPKDTLARALFKQPRQDFPAAVQLAYLKVADGGTALLGLLRGEAAGLDVSESGGSKAVNVSVAASAINESGVEAGWTEQTMTIPIGADGTFVGSFKLLLKPGKYTLKAGAVDPKSGKGSLVSTPIEAPDFAKVETAADGSMHPVPTAAPLLLVRDIEDLPAGSTPRSGESLLGVRAGTRAHGSVLRHHVPQEPEHLDLLPGLRSRDRPQRQGGFGSDRQHPEGRGAADRHQPQPDHHGRRCIGHRTGAPRQPRPGQIRDPASCRGPGEQEGTGAGDADRGGALAPGPP